MQIVIDITERLFANVATKNYNVDQLRDVVLAGKVIPAKHGRLIDADEIDTSQCDLSAIPTIIESNKDI